MWYVGLMFKATHLRRYFLKRKREMGILLGSLSELESLVDSLEEKSRQQLIADLMEIAMKSFGNAKTKLEKAVEEMRLAHEKYGDPEEAKVQMGEKLRCLREKLKGLLHLQRNEVEDAEMKISMAEKEFNTSYEEASLVCRKASDDLENSKKEFESAMQYLEQVRKDADDLNVDIQGYESGMPIRTTQLLKEIGEETKQLMVDITDMSNSERLNMIKILAGRVREIQDNRELSLDDKSRVKQIFGALGEMSGMYRPGFIEAMNRSHVCDWGQYVKDATEAFAEALHTRVDRERMEEERKKRADEEKERRIVARENCASLMEALRDLVQTSRSEENVEKILSLTETILKDVSPDDETLLDILDGCEELFVGEVFRALRRNLTKLGGGLTIEYLTKQFPKGMEYLKGKKVVLVGGVSREDRRFKMEKLFGVDSLEWVSSWRNAAGNLNSLAERAKNGTVDIIVEITSLCGHNVENVLSTACDGLRCKFVRVSQGYGASRIIQSIEQQAAREVENEVS
jgi:tetratricopeptide (TPR) repeat protein